MLSLVCVFLSTGLDFRKSTKSNLFNPILKLRSLIFAFPAWLSMCSYCSCIIVSSLSPSHPQDASLAKSLHHLILSDYQEEPAIRGGSFELCRRRTPSTKLTSLPPESQPTRRPPPLRRIPSPETSAGIHLVVTGRASRSDLSGKRIPRLQNRFISAFSFSIFSSSTLNNPFHKLHPFCWQEQCSGFLAQ